MLAPTGLPESAKRGTVRSMNRWSLAIVLLLLAFCIASDSAANVPTNRMRLDLVDVYRGLPTNSVRAVLPDQEGFVWIGTQDGLARFDGDHLELWRSQRDDTNSLAENAVAALATDDAGRLYVAHPRLGISVLDGSRHRVERWDASRNGLASDRVLKLLTAKDGRVWALFYNGAVQWLDADAKRARSLPSIHNQRIGAVRALGAGPASGLWLAADTGLWRFEVGRQVLTLDPRLAPEVTATTRVLIEDGSGTLWVGAESGLWRLARDDTRSVELPFSAREDAEIPEVESLLLDHQQRLWIGTRHGAFVYDRARQRVVERLDHDPADRQSLGSSRVTALAQGEDHVVWLGTWSGGLAVHDPDAAMIRSFRHLPGDPSSLPTNPVVAIATEQDGSLWLALGESGGLVQFDLEHGVRRRFHHRQEDPNGLSSNFLISLARDHDGRLWIGSGDRGLDRFDPATGHIERFGFGNTDGIPGPTVRALLVTRKGDLVVGTLEQGLAIRCPGCAQFVRHRSSHKPGQLPDDRITALAESADGRWWIGTRGAGLVLREQDGKTFQRVPLAIDGGASLNISDLLEDPQGRLWISTYGDGAIRVEPKADTQSPWSAQRFDVRNGLSADHVLALTLGSDGSLWISTARGLDRIDRASLAIRRFGLRSGALAGGYFLGAMASLSDGRIVAGGMEGMSLLDPRVLGDPRGAAQPRLTAFSVFNEVLIPGGEPRLHVDENGIPALHLGHRDEMVGFRFTAPSFGARDLPRFRYRLEGYDRDWILADDDQRTATYTRIPPGQYTFRVQTLDDLGGRDAPEAHVQVTMTAAPWRSPLAYLGYAVSAAGLIAFVIWRVQRRRLERARVAAEARENTRRLSAALWGSGAELWELDVASGMISRDDRLEGLRINDSPRSASYRDFTEFIHPDDRPAVGAALRQAIEGTAAIIDISYRTLDSNGDWVWLLTRGRAIALDEQGKPQRFVGTNQNISGLKRVEAELRRLADELELRVEQRTADLTRANVDLKDSLRRIQYMQRQLVESEKMASLGALVAGVAHEINTPIGVALTAASFLREEARQLRQAQRNQTLTASMLTQFESQIDEGSEMILANLDRAITIVRSFKQVAVDTASEAPREIDLPDYFEEVLTALHPRLRKSEHRIEVAVPEPLRFTTHPVAIYQIVTNLVVNALVHAFEGVEQGQMILAATADGSDIVIEFRDNGRGMPPAVRDRVFEPFFTTRRGRGGSGLGMHIVFNLVTQRLRGSIVCESESGKGTRFVIRFPRTLHEVAPGP